MTVRYDDEPRPSGNQQTQQGGQNQEPVVNWGTGFNMPGTVVGSGPPVREFVGRLRTRDPKTGAVLPAPWGTYTNQYGGRIRIGFDFISPILDNGAPYDGTKGYEVEMNVNLASNRIGARSGAGMFAKSVAEMTGCALDLWVGVMPEFTKCAQVGQLVHMACVDEYFYGINRETQERQSGVVWHLMDILTPAQNEDGSVKTGYYHSKFHDREMKGSDVPSRHQKLNEEHSGNQPQGNRAPTANVQERAEVVRNEPPPSLNENGIAKYNWQAALSNFEEGTEYTWRELRVPLRDLDIDPVFSSTIMIPAAQNTILKYLLDNGLIVNAPSGNDDAYIIGVMANGQPVEQSEAVVQEPVVF